MLLNYFKLKKVKQFCLYLRIIIHNQYTITLWRNMNYFTERSSLLAKSLRFSATLKKQVSLMTKTMGLLVLAS